MVIRISLHHPLHTPFHPPFAVELNTDRFGADYASQPAANAAACYQICSAARPTCKAFTFTEGENFCYLKNAVTAPSACSYCTSGVQNPLQTRTCWGLICFGLGGRGVSWNRQNRMQGLSLTSNCCTLHNWSFGPPMTSVPFSLQD